MAPADHRRIVVDADHTVSARLTCPPDARACYVMAHGAGAGMDHPFMATVAAGLAARGIATFRYQFPFSEAGSRRPDRPGLAQATVRAAVTAATAAVPALPLFAGGKSFGGRMTSQAQAEAALPGVRGIAFFGFPLHPPKRPSCERADHLAAVALPMLALQGTRDALAAIDLMRSVVAALGPRVTLVAIDDADHGFHVPVRSGRTDEAVLAILLDRLVAWIDTVLAAPAAA